MAAARPCQLRSARRGRGPGGGAGRGHRPWTMGAAADRGGAAVSQLPRVRQLSESPPRGSAPSRGRGRVDAGHGRCRRQRRGDALERGDDPTGGMSSRPGAGAVARRRGAGARPDRPPAHRRRGAGQPPPADRGPAGGAICRQPTHPRGARDSRERGCHAHLARPHRAPARGRRPASKRGAPGAGCRGRQRRLVGVGSATAGVLLLRPLARDGRPAIAGGSGPASRIGWAAFTRTTPVR